MINFMMVEPGFLAKCEQFLLHPAVRALSLAERVDFLERKVRALSFFYFAALLTVNLSRFFVVCFCI